MNKKKQYELIEKADKTMRIKLGTIKDNKELHDTIKIKHNVNKEHNEKTKKSFKLQKELMEKHNLKWNGEYWVKEK